MRFEVETPSVLTHSFSTRREVFFQRAPGTCILLEDDIGFGGPLEGIRFGVALGEPGLDGSQCRPVTGSDVQACIDVSHAAVQSDLQALGNPINGSEH